MSVAAVKSKSTDSVDLQMIVAAAKIRGFSFSDSLGNGFLIPGGSTICTNADGHRDTARTLFEDMGIRNVHLSVEPEYLLTYRMGSVKVDISTQLGEQAPTRLDLVFMAPNIPDAGQWRSISEYLLTETFVNASIAVKYIDNNGNMSELVFCGRDLVGPRSEIDPRISARVPILKSCTNSYLTYSNNNKLRAEIESIMDQYVDKFIRT